VGVRRSMVLRALGIEMSARRLAVLVRSQVAELVDVKSVLARRQPADGGGHVDAVAALSKVDRAGNMAVADSLKDADPARDSFSHLPRFLSAGLMDERSGDNDKQKGGANSHRVDSSGDK